MKSSVVAIIRPLRKICPLEKECRLQASDIHSGSTLTSDLELLIVEKVPIAPDTDPDLDVLTVHNVNYFKGNPGVDGVVAED